MAKGSGMIHPNMATMLGVSSVSISFSTQSYSSIDPFLKACMSFIITLFLTGFNN